MNSYLFQVGAAHECLLWDSAIHFKSNSLLLLQLHQRKSTPSSQHLWAIIIIWKISCCACDSSCAAQVQVVFHIRKEIFKFNYWMFCFEHHHLRTPSSSSSSSNHVRRFAFNLISKFIVRIPGQWSLHLFRWYVNVCLCVCVWMCLLLKFFRILNVFHFAWKLKKNDIIFLLYSYSLYFSLKFTFMNVYQQPYIVLRSLHTYTHLAHSITDSFILMAAIVFFANLYKHNKCDET